MIRVSIPHNREKNGWLMHLLTRRQNSHRGFTWSEKAVPRTMALWHFIRGVFQGIVLKPELSNYAHSASHKHCGNSVMCCFKKKKRYKSMLFLRKRGPNQNFTNICSENSIGNVFYFSVISMICEYNHNISKVSRRFYQQK